MPGTINVDATCSLAEAIENANNDNADNSDCEAGDGNDVINLHRDVTLTGTLPAISSHIRIEGHGYTIDGAGSYRIFTLNSSDGDLSLLRVTLRNGSSDTGGAARVEAGRLDIKYSTLRDNSASGNGGGIYITGGKADISLSP